MTNDRKALCVGINNFKNYPQFALRGCVNDTKDMSNIINKGLGFDKSDITILTDEQATKKNIINSLESMIKDAQTEKLKYIVWTLSSHGSQGSDTSGDEDDHLDELFVTYDITSKGEEWDENTVISDDECANLFSKLPENVLLEVFFDTCHSGTGLKAADLAPDRKPRFIPGATIEAIEKANGRRIHKLREALLEKGVKNHVLWAACSDAQTSADANIEGGWHGAFTYYFNKASLNSMKQTRGEILRNVLKGLDSGKYGQTPQLECNVDFKKKPIGQ
jgi:metacaspase-1